MKALILAAGRGTRVQPVTYFLPKPMIPILDRPVMELLLQLLVKHGVTEVMINTSYLAPIIENYFGNGARFGVQLAYSFEGVLEAGRIVDRPVGSAGAIRKIQDHSGLFDSTFLVLCGDAVIDLDLTELVARHRRSGAIATIALQQVPWDNVSSYGVVVRDDQGFVRSFQEKPASSEALSNTVNTGIYVFEPEVLNYIPAGQPYDIGSQLFPALLDAQEPVYGVDIPFQWLDIGQVTDYHAVLMQALQGQVHGVERPGREIEPGLWLGLNVRMQPETVNWSGPVCVGGSATIEPGATLIGPCMIGPGCIVEHGAHVERSVIFDYTRVSSRAEVRDMVVIGSYCVHASGEVIDLNRVGTSWVIADARGGWEPLTDEKRAILEAVDTHRPPGE